MTKLPLPRIVELVRVSTKGQADKGTPENQRRELDALRKARPGVLVERLEALGVSGTLGIADRADLQALVRLRGAYDELRVWNLDRLTRSDDFRERAAIFGVVSDAGARIVDCSGRIIDPADESGMGELDYYLQTLFSARERKKIGARTLAGRRRKAEDGLLSQGSPPFGRKLNHETKAWELVPSETEIYRRIIREVLSGRSVRQVAAGLNRDGVPPARGSKWAHSSIKRLLHHPAIVGNYKVCGHETQIPAIATQQEWDAVRNALRMNSFCATPASKRPALLRGLLRCKACGRRACVLSDGAGTVHRYGCTRPGLRPAPCPDRRTLRAPDVDAAVRAALLEMLLDSNALTQAIKGQDEGATKSNAGRDLKRAEKELSKLEAREERTLVLINDGLVSEQVARKQLETIKALRAEAEAKRKRANVASRHSAAPTKELMAAAREMGRALKGASAERMRELMRILIPAAEPYGVWLGRKGIEMVGTLPLGGDRRLATTC